MSLLEEKNGEAAVGKTIEVLALSGVYTSTSEISHTVENSTTQNMEYRSTDFILILLLIPLRELDRLIQSSCVYSFFLCVCMCFWTGYKAPKDNSLQLSRLLRDPPKVHHVFFVSHLSATSIYSSDSARMNILTSYSRIA